MYTNIYNTHMFDKPSSFKRLLKQVKYVVNTISRGSNHTQKKNKTTNEERNDVKKIGECDSERIATKNNIISRSGLRITW